MNAQNKTPSAWWFGLAGLALILGCVAATAIVYGAFPGLPGALKEHVNLDNLTQVVVPGAAQITFDEPGAYAVYYEYESVVNGVRYAGSKQPPALECHLSGQSGDARVEAVPDYVATNTYSTQHDERVGVLIMSLPVDEPDTYTFACRYTDGAGRPEIVVAVGPNFVWEFFDVSARVGLSLLAGLVVLLVSLLAAIGIVIVVALKRRQQPGPALER